MAWTAGLRRRSPRAAHLSAAERLAGGEGRPVWCSSKTKPVLSLTCSIVRRFLGDRLLLLLIMAGFLSSARPPRGVETPEPASETTFLTCFSAAIGV